MRSIYSLSVFFYAFAIKIASLFNPKAKLWVEGRKNWKSRLSVLKNEPVYWFHCASLGEFEQARPIMEKMNLKEKNAKLLVTFFSPSGYEVRKNYDLADVVMYLPKDSIAGAKYFVAELNLKAAFFIKYEFWFNFLFELKKKNIPTYLIAGVFRENHFFFRGNAKWFKEQLKAFQLFFVQDENSLKILQKNGFNNAVISGDTRYDKVFENAQKAQPVEWVEKFKNEKNTLIAGSSWQKEEEILCRFINQNESAEWNFIIAPHKIDKAHIAQIKGRLNKPAVLFSEINAEKLTQSNVLIVDSIGQLSNLYQYGDIAFIGGAFRGALHNILEAATFSLPVIFGPEYQKFPEAQALIDAGGAFSIYDDESFRKTFQIISQDGKNLKAIGQQSKAFIETHRGATALILEKLKADKIL